MILFVGRTEMTKHTGQNRKLCARFQSESHEREAFQWRRLSLEVEVGVGRRVG